MKVEVLRPDDAWGLQTYQAAVCELDSSSFQTAEQTFEMIADPDVIMFEIRDQWGPSFAAELHFDSDSRYPVPWKDQAIEFWNP